MSPAPSNSTFEQGTEIKEMMFKHFKDDGIAFAEINKNFDRLYKVIELNGEHFSSMGKNLAELKTTITEHIIEVTPILQNYKDMQATKRTLARYGKGTIGLGAVVAAWIAIKNFLLK